MVGVEDPQTSVVFSGRYDITEADSWTSRCAERLQVKVQKAFIEAGMCTKLLKQRIKKFLVLFCYVSCYFFSFKLMVLGEVGGLGGMDVKH